jgi:hypothetical protein
VDVSRIELWRGFDAWLNRDPSRSTNEITPNSCGKSSRRSFRRCAGNWRDRSAGLKRQRKDPWYRIS